MKNIRYYMKDIYYTKHLWMLLGTLFLLSCSPNDKKELSDGNEEEKDVIVSFSQNALQTIDLLPTHPTDSYHLLIEKNSSTPNDIPVRIRPWDEHDLQAYNQKNATEYQLLPEKYYSLEQDAVLKADEKAMSIPVLFKSSEIFAMWKNGQPLYVLPLQIESTSAVTQENRRQLFLFLNINADMVKLESPSEEYLLNQEEVNICLRSYYTATHPYEKEFRCTMSIAENAETLIAEYNASHATSYQLLPQDSYRMEEFCYTPGERQATANITIRTTHLPSAYYLLPIRLAATDHEEILPDASVRMLTFVRGYRNPIIAYSAPDPTVIRAQDGYFYLYGTENTRNIPIYRSKDLIDWEYKGTAFTDNTRPKWDGDHNLWAPEIRYFNGHYVLYYSWAKWGDEWNSNVGVATSDSPVGPFVDQGCLIDSKTIGVQNSIDQFFFEEDGKKYMFWGSFRGIYATELTDNGLKIKKNDDGTPVLKKRICGNRFEGTNLLKRGNFYYLFASIGRCCEGANSTYQTVVGRSTHLLGPYLDRDGKDMLHDNCEILLSGNDTWAGPGHNSILIQDDEGTDWMIYHGYKKQEAENGRYVLMDKLIWNSDGWPTIKDGVPSLLELAPVFHE